MRFVCDKCQAKYSIADERVENKVIKLNCQKCGHEITLRGPITKAAPAEQKRAGDATMSQIQPIARSKPSEGFDAAFSDEEPEEPRETTRIANLAELEQMRKEATATAISEQAEKKKPTAPVVGVWMVLINNEQKGPFTVEEVKAKLKSGELNPRSYVWKEGMPEWARLQGVAEFGLSAPSVAKPVAKPLAVADLVDPRFQVSEQTRPAFDTRAAKKKIEPAATASGDFDELFGPAPNTGEPPAPFDGPFEPSASKQREPLFAAPDEPAIPIVTEPPRDQTRGVIQAAGLFERKKRQRMYMLAALGTVALILLLLVLDMLSIITIPAFGAAYNLVGIENRHKEEPAPQYSDQLTEEERKRIREGLMGKKPPEVVPEKTPAKEAPVAASGEAPPPVPVPAPVKEDKLLNEVMGDDSKLAVKLEAPKMRTPAEDLPAGMNATIIAKVVDGNQRAIKSCFERSLKRGTQVTGRLEVEFSIASSGEVKSADIKSAKHKGTEFGECVVTSVKAWKFPRFNGEVVTVEYPFILSAGQNGSPQ